MSSVSTDASSGRLSRWDPATAVAIAVIVVVVCVAPFVLGTALLQVGLIASSAIIAAIGLNILTGSAGQLSLAHAFFVAVGAYGYAVVTAEPGNARTVGLGLPPLLGFLFAGLLGGLAGLLFSPIASKLRGLYLGVASVALVFLGQHFFFSARSLTGGFNGRRGEPFAVPGFSFTDDDPILYVLGVEFGKYQRLWFLAAGLVALAYVFARSLLSGRPGRAMQAIRDNETMATAMGVNVARHKAAAFMTSSVYAGIAGALLAFSLGRVVPESFGFVQSVDYLAMIVIGGLGSVGGAVAGAIFVASLPLLLSQYAGYLPFLAQPGSGGLEPGTFARYVYGLAVILVIMFAPRGLSALGPAVTRIMRGRRNDRPAATEPPAQAPSAS